MGLLIGCIVAVLFHLVFKKSSAKPNFEEPTKQPQESQEKVVVAKILNKEELVSNEEGKKRKTIVVEE